jgi:hypothetical protein
MVLKLKSSDLLFPDLVLYRFAPNALPQTMELYGLVSDQQIEWVPE